MSNCLQALLFSRCSTVRPPFLWHCVCVCVFLNCCCWSVPPDTWPARLPLVIPCSLLSQVLKRQGIESVGGPKTLLLFVCNQTLQTLLAVRAIQSSLLFLFLVRAKICARTHARTKWREDQRHVNCAPVSIIRISKHYI